MEEDEQPAEDPASKAPGAQLQGQLAALVTNAKRCWRGFLGQ